MTRAPAENAPRRRGRPPVAPEDRKDERVTLRLTRDEAEQLAALGGAEWVRAQLARARRK